MPVVRLRTLHIETLREVEELEADGRSYTAASKDLGILRNEAAKLRRIIDRKVREGDITIDLRARAAAAEGRTREHGASIRQNLRQDHDCPYCGRPLGNDYHADHIYPVSKGGQSTMRNMVYVCVVCNTRKGTLTLAGFVRKYNLNREEIEMRLRELGKEW